MYLANKNSNLYSKEALLWLLGWALIVTIIMYAFFKVKIVVIIEILICALYARVILQSRPWNELDSSERSERRFYWSGFIAWFFTDTLFIISCLIGIACEERSSEIWLPVFIIISLYIEWRKSEAYLEIALKDGGPYFRSPQRETVT